MTSPHAGLMNLLKTKSGILTLSVEDVEIVFDGRTLDCTNTVAVTVRPRDEDTTCSGAGGTKYLSLGLTAILLDLLVQESPHLEDLEMYEYMANFGRGEDKIRILP
jgi:hypothetical protein